MKPNPFRVALVVLGIGVMSLGAVIWLFATIASGADGGPGPVIAQGIGTALIGIGWLPFIAWLVVGALQHVPQPRDEPDDEMSEEEIAAWVKVQKAEREKAARAKKD